ncbi:unnamed protein product, partial [Prorocentrum cordatum]
MTTEFGPTWHCMVGRHFASYVTYEKNRYTGFLHRADGVHAVQDALRGGWCGGRFCVCRSSLARTRTRHSADRTCSFGRSTLSVIAEPVRARPEASPGGGEIAAAALLWRILAGAAN